MAQSIGCQAGLKTIRETLGVSRRDVADRLAVTVTSYGRFERGERPLYFNQAVTIATMFGVTLEQLTREPTTDDMVALTQRKLSAVDEHAPEMEAMAEAGRVMGNDGVTDITELAREWGGDDR